jgi:hypothetical protein
MGGHLPVNVYKAAFPYKLLPEDNLELQAVILLEECYLLGYNAVYSVESQPMFRRNTSPPSSGSKNKPSKKPAWKQVASRAYSSTLKIEAICSSETSVYFQRTARHYIAQDSTLHNRSCENLKLWFYISSLIDEGTSNNITLTLDVCGGPHL